VIDRAKSKIRRWATQRTVGYRPGWDRDAQIRREHPDWPVVPGRGPAPPDDEDQGDSE
jgi:hypothetical protein